MKKKRFFHQNCQKVRPKACYKNGVYFRVDRSYAQKKETKNKKKRRIFIESVSGDP